MDAVGDHSSRSNDDPVRVLSVAGEPVEGYEPTLDDETLRSMYADMILYRRFDERAVSLQRQGRLGTYAPLAGQEATQVGTTYALEPADWIAYQYREHGAVLSREMMAAYLTYWMGHEAGNAAIADVNVFPLNISIGSQIPHATGLGMAIDYRGDDAVVCCHFGDGATSEGDFHEGLNFAGVFDVPVVFVCQNNGWAISTPRERQTAADSLAARADAYGFDGVQVDGMDPLAVYEVTRQATTKARSPGDGQTRPTLIETLTYRYGAHTTADDPTNYREEAAVDAWRERDPIDRLEAYLEATGRLDDEAIDAIESRADERVEAAVSEAEAFAGDPEAMFAHVYDEPTPRLAAQREALADLRERHGDEALTRDE